MKIIFKDSDLEELYEKGASAEKKHGFHPDVVKRFQKVIDIMKSAPDPDALWHDNALNYESLDGDKRGESSVRVNEQFRIEFSISEGADPTVTILTLSDHYHNGAKVKMK